MLEQFVILRTLLANNSNNINSFNSLEPMKNLGTIGSEIIFDHHIGDLKDFVIVHDSGRRSAYGSSDKNMRGSSILSSIYGGFDNDVFARFESAFRAIEKENELLREKYIRW